MSVFAAYSQVNLALPELNRSLDWFKNQFNPIIDPYTSLKAYSDEQIQSDDPIKKHALEFIKEADFNFRKELSFYNAYKQGKFGAIPNLNRNELI